MAKIKQINGKDYIFCAWRRKYVRLTPEEWVRQQFLHTLADRYGYPESLIAVEVRLTTGRRADALIYTKDMQPLVLIEFKADTVALTQRVLDQAAVYNRQFHVPYLILNNGPETVIARVEDQTITFLPAVPDWTEMTK